MRAILFPTGAPGVDSAEGENRQKWQGLQGLRLPRVRQLFKLLKNCVFQPRSLLAGGLVEIWNCTPQTLQDCMPSINSERFSDWGCPQFGTLPSPRRDRPGHSHTSSAKTAIRKGGSPSRLREQPVPLKRQQKPGPDEPSKGLRFKHQGSTYEVPKKQGAGPTQPAQSRHRRRFDLQVSGEGSSLALWELTADARPAEALGNSAGEQKTMDVLC